MRSVSDEFQGTSYNLLTRNCNHFTSRLVQRLTGRSGPGWLNRAASIGVALPCVVPREWVEPPDYATAEGELVDEDEDSDDVAAGPGGSGRHGTRGGPTESSRMLRSSTQQQRKPRLVMLDSQGSSSEWDSEPDHRRAKMVKGKGKQKATTRDESGRALPPAEAAPTSSNRR